MRRCEELELEDLRALAALDMGVAMRLHVHVHIAAGSSSRSEPSHEGRRVIAVGEEDLHERQSCAYTVLADAVLSHPLPGAHRISTSTAYTNMT